MPVFIAADVVSFLLRRVTSAGLTLAAGMQKQEAFRAGDGVPSLLIQLPFN
jgi:hypothetical protein